MRNFSDVIKEVAGILRGAALLNTVQNATILFLIIYLFFSLFNLFPLTLSCIFTVFYLLSTWIKKTQVYTARFVEKRFPFLKDKLTTAADTLSDENFVVNKLRVDVAKKLRDVDASSFFFKGKVFAKTGAILGIIFIMLFATALDFRVFDAKNFITDLRQSIGDRGEGFNAGVPGEGFGDDGIFTDGEGLQFHISKTVDVTDIEDVQNLDFKKEEFLSYDELVAIGAKDYKDPITEEEKEVVKNYFERIQNR